MAPNNSYRFETGFLSKGNGGNSVGMAAYNSRENLTDHHSGKTFYHRSRGNVLHSELRAPPGVPPWLEELIKSKEVFWSHVEKYENRRNSQLAQTFFLNLPHELPPKEMVVLARKFADEVFVRHGRIVQIDIHPPDPEGNKKHFHLHLLATLREITLIGFGNKKREWTPWRDASILQRQRKMWSEMVNQALEANGFEPRFDHRSLKDQGIDRKPQRPKGQAKTNIERRRQKQLELGLQLKLDGPDEADDIEISFEDPSFD